LRQRLNVLRQRLVDQLAVIAAQFLGDRPRYEVAEWNDVIRRIVVVVGLDPS
jgi:hypothetical protein